MEATAEVHVDDGTTREVVPSVSITNMLRQRAGALEKLEAIVALAQECDALLAAGGFGTFGMVTTGQRYGDSPLLSGSFVGDCQKHMDAHGWNHLMHHSGLWSLMDAKAREEWNHKIEKRQVPVFNEPNIRATFEALHASRGDIFERGVINVFQRLSWSYKTNLPQKFGKRVVYTYLRGQMSGGKWGVRSLGHVNHRGADALDDLERVFRVLDGKPEPDHRNGWYARLAKCDTIDNDIATSDYMQVKSYRNGNGHVTFLRPSLVERMNKIIAKHYPNALPAPK